MNKLDTNEKWVASLIGHGFTVFVMWVLTVGLMREHAALWVLSAIATVAYVALFVCWRLWLRVKARGGER